MGRRKLELKLIEDKTSRQVAFSKRRIGFLKKARHLSVLCDVQVAAVVFSGRGKLYDFCSSNTSLERILERYEKSSLEGEEGVATKADNTEECHPSSPRYRTCQELLQTVERFVEEPNAEMPTVNDFVQLEEEITGALMQIRSRKTQLMMEYKRTLEAEENKLREENQQMEQQVAEAANNGKRAGAVAGDLNNLASAVAGDLNNLATNQTKLPPLETLPLFPT